MQITNIEEKEGYIFVVIDGKLEEIPVPKSGFGECNIKWHNGKIVETDESKKTRYRAR
jgi:hypothetical protein